MKKITLIICLLILGNGLKAQIFSSKKDTVNATIATLSYSSVVDVDSTKKDALYETAAEWIKTNFKDPGETVVLHNKEAGKIVAKGVTPAHYKSLGNKYKAGLIKYEIILQVKDNRYRYEITKLEHEKDDKTRLGSGGSLENKKPACGFVNMTSAQWNSIKSDAEEQILVLIENLKSKMARAAITSDEEW